MIGRKVGVLIMARIAKTNGTGAKVAVDIRVLEVTILRELMGNVLVYSKPAPSALSRARGIIRANMPPMEVAIRTTIALSTPVVEISNAEIRVCRAGRAK